MKRLLVVPLLLLSLDAAAFEWSRAGLYGADVRSLVVHPDQPDVVYLGTSQGEVYVSRDGARTWVNPRNSVPFPGFVLDNLAVDRTGRLWVAGWGLWGEGLVAVSTDDGKTWERRDEGVCPMSIRAFALVPESTDTMFVGGLTGVFRSRDEGRSWTRISDQPNVESLAVDPRSADTIYLGTWRQMWRTDDGGASWKHVAEGMVLDTDVFGININPANPDDVWLSTCGWVYHSKNRGDTWTRYRDGFENRRVHVVARDLVNPRALWAGSVAGLYRTLDLGKSWKLLSNENLVITAIAMHPDRPMRMILGTEGDGVYVSHDRGETFERTSSGLHNVRISDLVADPLAKGHLYAAVMSGGAASGIYESHDGGTSWDRINRSPLPAVLSLVLHEGEKGRRLLAGTESGVYWSVNGAEWARAEPSTIPLRVGKILPYNSFRLFAATADGVFTSKDGGESWTRLAGSWDFARDLAVGSYDGKTALYALHGSGLSAFNEDGWHPVAGAPPGTRLLLQRSASGETLLVGDSKGVRAGEIDEGRWVARALDLPHGSVLQIPDPARRRLLVFTSNGERHLMMTDDVAKEPAPTGVPLDAKEIVSVQSDPFDEDRLYIATTATGIIVLDRERRVESGEPAGAADHFAGAK